jgi:tetratricopeptide (TPR) repeat protein
MAQSFEEDPRYGETREARIENAKKLNFLRDAVQMKNWNEAAVYVKDLMTDAPASTMNIYIWGATVYKNKVARARSVAQKNILVDSVMLIYDRRAEHFGTDQTRKADILQRKAVDYVALNPMDGAGVRKFYKDAVDASGGGAASGTLIVAYFQQLVNGFKSFDIAAADLLTEYERLTPMMETAEETPRNNFNTLFASSGAASCDVLEELYKNELAPDPENIDVLTKAFNLMSMIDCQSDFYVQVAEKYYSKTPSTPTAIRLATVFENRKEYTKALTYLNEILPTEADPIAKANIYVRIAASELGASRSSAAASAARSAIALNADNGFAHMFLAEAYIAGSAGCGGFHAQTVFWLAYDELARARQAFAGDEAQTARIDARMGNCRANFPTFEEGFMYVDGYADGKSHHVSCGWISGTTTIRSR